MKTPLISFYAACIVSVRAIKSSQDEWWMSPSVESTPTTTTQPASSDLTAWWVQPSSPSTKQGGTDLSNLWDEQAAVKSDINSSLTFETQGNLNTNEWNTQNPAASTSTQKSTTSNFDPFTDPISSTPPSDPFASSTNSGLFAPNSTSGTFQSNTSDNPFGSSTT